MVILFSNCGGFDNIRYSVVHDFFGVGFTIAQDGLVDIHIFSEVVASVNDWPLL